MTSVASAAASACCMKLNAVAVADASLKLFQSCGGSEAALTLRLPSSASNREPDSGAPDALLTANINELNSTRTATSVNRAVDRRVRTCRCCGIEASSESGRRSGITDAKRRVRAAVKPEVWSLKLVTPISAKPYAARPGRSLHHAPESPGGIC